MYASKRTVILPSDFGTEVDRTRIQRFFIEETVPPIHPQEWTREDLRILMEATDQIELVYRHSGSLVGYVTIDSCRFEIALFSEMKGAGLATEVTLLALRNYFLRPHSDSSVHTKIHRENRQSLRSARHLGWVLTENSSKQPQHSEWKHLRFEETSLWNPLPCKLMARFDIT
jgi:RimJ/RimL family protein N-acetyltransferase